MQLNISRSFLVKTALLLCLAFSQTTYCKAQATEPDNAGVYNTVDEAATFPGGTEELSNYLTKNIKYPDDARLRNLEGKVIVAFIIEKDGSLSDVHAVRSPNASLSKEAIRVIATSPKWQPAKVAGQAVRMNSAIPVDFKLANLHRYSQTNLRDTSVLYSDVQESPSFPGGLNAFGHYLSQSIRYPQYDRAHNVQGRVIVLFIVEKDGSLSDIRAVRSPDESLAQEAIRVMMASPAWVPGKQNGVAARVQYAVPISFTLAAK